MLSTSTPKVRAALQQCLFVSGQSNFPDTGDFHDRKWSSDANTEIQAASPEKTFSTNIRRPLRYSTGVNTM